MSRPRLSLQKVLGHWKTIRIHRHWVKYYCRLAHIRRRGWKHDLSKYSPIEFWESARYWTGISSPINETKKAQGYSKAWLHHRGRNPHHWAYWADNFSEGMTIYPMPKDDFVEMVCDFLAAGRAYMGDNFSYSREHAWWIDDRNKGNKAMNEVNKRMLDIIFSDLEYAENHMLSGCPTSLITSTPESLIKSGYIQEIWRANTNHDLANDYAII